MSDSTMTTPTSTADAVAWLKADKATDLLVEPLAAESIAGRVATPRFTESALLRIPTIREDPQAEWVQEGEEIPLSAMKLAEQTIAFQKIAGFVPISAELAADTDPALLEQVGRGLARDIARKVDTAFFGSRGDNEAKPKGLEDLENVTTLTATKLENLDVFSEARFAIAGKDAQLGSYVANPADAHRLANLKESSASARTLLQSIPEGDQNGAVLSIDGVRLFVSTAVTAGTIWAIPADRVVLGIRSDVSISISDQVFFSSDRLAIRATMRVGFGFTHQPSIVKITVPTA